MISFRKITLDDRDWMRAVLETSPRMSCEYAFGSQWIWREGYDEQVCKIGEMYLVRMRTVEGIKFLYPAGRGEIRPVIEALEEYCAENGLPFILFSATEEEAALLEREFPGKFCFINDRGSADYIYLQQDLAALSGKKYHGKRNHIARFTAQNDWRFEELDDHNLEECMDMSDRWYAAYETKNGQNANLEAEKEAVKRAISDYKTLSLYGGLLRANGRVVAYTIGEHLKDDTTLVHIEKAFDDVEGAYPTINREFAANLCTHDIYINREEDLGVEGLRKAKLSYHPVMLCPKIEVRIRT